MRHIVLYKIFRNTQRFRLRDFSIKTFNKYWKSFWLIKSTNNCVLEQLLDIFIKSVHLLQSTKIH